MIAAAAVYGALTLAITPPPASPSTPPSAPPAPASPPPVPFPHPLICEVLYAVTSDGNGAHVAACPLP